jgi:hypothetical protein
MEVSNIYGCSYRSLTAHYERQAAIGDLAHYSLQICFLLGLKELLCP